jgi:antitoxin component YwqK of YwqJK toxin-antitoxin module
LIKIWIVNSKQLPDKNCFFALKRVLKNYHSSTLIYLKLAFLICALLWQNKAAGINSLRLVISSDTLKKVEGNKTILQTFYTNGQVKEIIKLKNNKKHGIQKKYNNNGVLQSQIEYKNGLLCGDYITYNSEGIVLEKKSYRCNNTKSWLQGKYLEYAGKVLITKGAYKDSLKDGKWLQYHSSGQIKSEFTYKNGQAVGEQIFYANNGNIQYKNNLIEVTTNGKTTSLKHGKFISYHSTGQISAEGNYEIDKKSGLWREYTQKGDLYREIFYKDGKIHGVNNSYSNDGKIEQKSEFYEDIEINGKKYHHVFHGVKENYKGNGKLDRKEKYYYGKKEGTWESYHTNGNVREINTYKNNLQTGKALAYDEEGNKTFEVNYNIIKNDTIEISVKTGPEMRWDKNILLFETNYKDGKEDGTRKSYLKSGKLSSIMNFKDDLIQGENIEYYENGNVKTSKQYYSFYSALKEKKNNQIGWSYHFDESGQLKSKSYFDSTGTAAVHYNYNHGKLLQFSVAKVIELNYFPTGELLSEKIISQYANMHFARHYYLNGNIRKISFQNADNLIYNSLYFTSNGKFHYANGSFYNKPDTLLPAQYTISSILNAAHNKIIPNRFYTDSVKNGNYTLNYQNGKVYARMHFTADLPDGDFVFYHPETNDTMLYAKFKNGYLNGPWLEKFGGKNVWLRGMYTNQKQSGIWTRNQISGNAYEIRGFHPKTGQTNSIKEFYPNGILKSYNQYDTGEYESRDEKGYITGRAVSLDTLRKINVSEYYYPNSNTLKSRNYYFNKIQDSIAETYYASGKLQSKMTYKNGKRNGAYVEYFENGTLKRKSNWEDDKLEGMGIVVTEKGIDTLYYRNNNLQVKPATFPCACIDTTHCTSRNGFAPLLNHLLDYTTLETYIQKYLIPVDSLNYNSIFYTGFQNSNGHNAGFSSMNLMLFKEFAFMLPSNEQIKLIFNPCITKGYVSRMQISANYGIGNRAYTSVEFSPKRIALEFLKGPVKSNDANYKNFKAFFDTKYVEYSDREKLKITTNKPELNCFIPATLNNMIDIDIKKAKPLIFEPLNKFEIENFSIKLSAQEIESFFGIIANDASITIDYNNDKGKHQIIGKSDYLMLGGQYACGVIQISCTKNNNNVFKLKQNQVTFTIDELKKELISKGFERLNFDYKALNEELWLTFFTQ